MKKVLILCNDFPPLNSIGADRPYSWFKYFKQSGLEVIVITKDWRDVSPAPEKLVYGRYSTEDVKTENLPEGTIIRVPHKLILPDRILVKYGISKCVIFRKSLTFIYKLLSFLFPFFDKHYNIYLAAQNYLEKNDVDAVITTGEPFILFRYGYLLRKKFNIKWVADFRDGWYLNHETNTIKFFLNRFMIWYEFIFERKYMRRVDLINAVDQVMCGRLQELHKGKKATYAYNGLWQFYQPSGPPNNEKGILLTHTGTLTTGQRIEMLFDAIIELQRERKIVPGDLKLRMTGLEHYPNQLERVKKYTTEIQNYIITTPRVTKEEALKINYMSDFCVAFTDPALTNIYAKVYDYIASSTPILLIPTDHMLLEGIIKQLGAGSWVETVEELKAFLHEAIKNKKNGISPAKIAVDKEAAWFYSRESQAKKMAENIFSIL